MTQATLCTSFRNAILASCSALFLSGCLMSDPEPTDQEDLADTIAENRVSGSVGDGPVVGATLRAYRNDGEELAEFESTTNASYNISLKTKGKYYPLTITATGGTDLVTNLTPDFDMQSAVLAPGKQSVANVNPFSTFAVLLADELRGGATADNLRDAQAIVSVELNSGLSTLATSGPMTTHIDEHNIAEINRASETLSETVRRTRDALNGAGFSTDGDQVVAAIASDLTDHVLNGQGGRLANPRIAAVATIAYAQTLLEAMANELHVNGSNAMAALAIVLNDVSIRPPTTTIDELLATSEMVDQARVGLAAAMAIDTDSRIAGLHGAVSGLQAGMDASLVRSLLPDDYRDVLGNTLTMVANGDASTIDTVNDVVTSGGAPEDDPGPPSAPPPPVNQPPTISGIPVPEINVGDSFQFMPDANDPDGDTLSFSIANEPGWASFDSTTGALTGTPGDVDIGSYTNIRITVSDGTDSASIVFDIAVNAVSLGSVTLSWSAPTQNEDGTTLTDLAGYKLYWGTTPGDYTESVTIDNASVTTYVVENLAPGTYEFVATSYNASGVESRYSAPATKTVQ